MIPSFICQLQIIIRTIDIFMNVEKFDTEICLNIPSWACFDKSGIDTISEDEFRIDFNLTCATGFLPRISKAWDGFTGLGGGLIGCLNATSSTICFLGAFVGFCVGRYWTGCGDDVAKVCRATLVGVTVTWGGRYAGDPEAGGAGAPSGRTGGGTTRGTSSLTSSSLFGSWLRSSSSRSRMESRDTFSSSGTSFTGFTLCENSGAVAGKFGRSGRNVAGVSSPGPRGL